MTDSLPVYTYPLLRQALEDIAGVRSAGTIPIGEVLANVNGSLDVLTATTLEELVFTVDLDYACAHIFPAHLHGTIMQHSCSSFIHDNHEVPPRTTSTKYLGTYD